MVEQKRKNPPNKPTRKYASRDETNRLKELVYQGIESGKTRLEIVQELGIEITRYDGLRRQLLKEGRAERRRYVSAEQVKVLIQAGCSDEEIRLNLEIGQTTLYKRKRELMDAGEIPKVDGRGKKKDENENNHGGSQRAVGSRP
jgi:hypothetical protein